MKPRIWWRALFDGAAMELVNAPGCFGAAPDAEAAKRLRDANTPGLPVFVEPKLEWKPVCGGCGEMLGEAQTRSQPLEWEPTLGELLTWGRS